MARNIALKHLALKEALLCLVTDIRPGRMYFDSDKRASLMQYTSNYNFEKFCSTSPWFKFTVIIYKALYSPA
jgi:hypothetical protein